jgi:hypothetical protein
MSSANYQASWQSARAAAPPSVTIEQDTNGYRDNGEGERLKNVRGIMIPTLILWLICVLTSFIFYVLGWMSWSSSPILSNLVNRTFAGLTSLLIMSAVPAGYAGRAAIETYVAAKQPDQLDMFRQYRKRFVCCSIFSIITGLICVCFSIVLYFVPSIVSRE